MTTLLSALRRPAAYALVLGLTVVLGSGFGCGGGSGGNGGDGSGGGGGGAPTLQMGMSPSFPAGGPIPTDYVGNMPPQCSGMNKTPQLSWNSTGGAQGAVKSYAVVMEDTTVPWVHWILFNIPATTTSLPEFDAAPAPFPPGTPPGLMEGPNSWGNNYYDGPCPPGPPTETAGTVHTYVFTVYALSVADVTMAMGYFPAMTATDLRNLIQANSIASASYAGTYFKP